MKTKTFKLAEMIAELEQKLQTTSLPGTAPGGLSADPIIHEKIESKLEVLKQYPDLVVTVRKYSARQKDILEQALINPGRTAKGQITQNLDLIQFKKLAVQFGVINMQPRLLEMTKIQEKPEIWQFPDTTLNSDDFDWDLRDLMVEMIDEVNPKNWT